VQILRELGRPLDAIARNNPRKLVGIEGYGLQSTMAPAGDSASESTRRY